MPKFPEPPPVSSLEQIPALTHTLTAGTVISRIFFAGGEHPTTWDAFRYFGPTASRFDHHLLDEDNRPCLQGRGIMYLATGAESIPTCLAEVFQVSRIIDRHSRSPMLCGFELVEPIHLLDLSGSFVTTLGASTAIHSGPRPRARRWAQSLYTAYPEIDGILYCSSMFANEPAIALFERGLRAIPERPVFHRSLADSTLTNVLSETANKIRYALI